MNDKEKIKGLFNTLNYLKEYRNNYKDIIECREVIKIEDVKLVNDVCDELIIRDWVTQHGSKTKLCINRKGEIKINFYSNYYFFFLHEILFNIKTKVEKITNKTLGVISIIGIVWGSYYTYLDYEKNNKIELLETVILTKQKTIDSLKTELDSLKNKN